MIYVIKTEDDSAIKIGCTRSNSIASIHKRLATLQTSNHKKLELIHYMKGSFAHEKIIHGFLEQFKLTGEWFDYTDNHVQHFIYRLINYDLQSAVDYLSDTPGKFNVYESIHNRQRLRYKAREKRRQKVKSIA